MLRLKELVLEVAARLKEHGLTIATAESCTGGGLGYWLTSMPGSSIWYDRGFTTYSNAAKVEMLGVDTNTIISAGAVSAETVAEMAAGALKLSQADISIAITGVAGPDGGTDEKPVGTVWIGLHSRKHAPSIRLHHFTGDRQAIRLSAMVKALEELLLMTNIINDEK